MPFSRQTFAALLSLVALGASIEAAGLDGSSGGAASRDASAWSEGLRSRARLVAGGPDGDVQLAAVAIALAAGFKTYWRFPGESGLPPAFDWSRSTNVGHVEVLWPAPHRFEDASGVSYGYEGGVTVPLRVRPQHPGEPVHLDLRLDYGVCKDICIPAQAEAALTLPARAGAERPAIEAALKRVPQPRAIGAPGDLAILDLSSTAEGKPAVAVPFTAPAEPVPQLFVEAPDGWYVAARAEPTRPAAAQAPATFVLDVFERPKAVSGSVELRLTLVAGERAIETRATLDPALLLREP